ncbi:hypothetical protein [Vibrio fortis]|uniref:hypothetical protein n=1 Tax=Vibrio fortis TaxID=212667 RepID=UPI0038CD42CD
MPLTIKQYVTLPTESELNDTPHNALAKVIAVKDSLVYTDAHQQAINIKLNELGINPQLLLTTVYKEKLSKHHALTYHCVYNAKTITGSQITLRIVRIPNIPAAIGFYTSEGYSDFMLVE